MAVSWGVGPRQGSDPALLWLGLVTKAPSLGTTICHGLGPKKTKKKKKKKGVFRLPAVVRLAVCK